MLAARLDDVRHVLHDGIAGNFGRSQKYRDDSLRFYVTITCDFAWRCAKRSEYGRLDNSSGLPQRCYGCAAKRQALQLVLDWSSMVVSLRKNILRRPSLDLQRFRATRSISRLPTVAQVKHELVERTLVN